MDCDRPVPIRGRTGRAPVFAARQAPPSFWRIEVAEQNPEGATYGFGSFLRGALAFLERDEPQLSRILQAEMERWPMQRIVHRDECVDIDGTGFPPSGALRSRKSCRSCAATLA